jgi:hypothetical protein
MVQTSCGGAKQAQRLSKTPVKQKKAVPKTSPSPSKKKALPAPVTAAQPLKTVRVRQLLLSPRDDEELIESTLVCRPPKRNKSPYVGDILLTATSVSHEASSSETAPDPLVHLPKLDIQKGPDGKRLSRLEPFIRFKN